MANPAEGLKFAAIAAPGSAIEGYRMSFVIAAPEFVSSAASEVAGIGSSLSAANAGGFSPDDGGAGRCRR